MSPIWVYMLLLLFVNEVDEERIFHQPDFNTYVWNDGNEIYYVHDVFQKGNFAGTSAESNDELEREPNLKVSNREREREFGEEENCWFCVALRV